MEYQNLLITEENGIVTVTLNRPKALNALNAQTMSELQYFFGIEAPQKTEMKGVVLTGAGEKAFVAGADIKEFVGLDEAAGEAMSKKGQDIFFLIERFPKPVIAAIDGFTLGAGCELAMACHLRIASEKSRFGQPEVNLGLLPGYGGTQRLVQYIGKSKAMELCLTGDMIDAHEAHRLGLVNHITPIGEEITKAKSIIEKISKKGPMAVQKVIDAINAYFQHDTDGYAVEYTAFGECIGSEDAKEGATAFIEKRKANFQGK